MTTPSSKNCIKIRLNKQVSKLLIISNNTLLLKCSFVFVLSANYFASIVFFSVFYINYIVLGRFFIDDNVDN